VLHNTSNNSWLFRRDEIDALEDELDEVFDLHERSDDSVNRSIEEAVIDEQERTEHAYEHKLADILGPDARDEDEPHTCEHCQGGVPDGVAFKDMLSQDRDSLYARSYRWAVEVFAWAKDGYWQVGMRNRDMFRVLLNAYLVPVKVTFALSEAARDDEYASRIAGLEYDLAICYLSRTRESLGSLRAMGLEHADLRRMIGEADALGLLLLERRAKFPPV